jgi:hypothetical protein
MTRRGFRIRQMDTGRCLELPSCGDQSSMMACSGITRYALPFHISKELDCPMCCMCWRKAHSRAYLPVQSMTNYGKPNSDIMNDM